MPLHQRKSKQDSSIDVEARKKAFSPSGVGVLERLARVNYDFEVESDAQMRKDIFTSKNREGQLAEER